MHPSAPDPTHARAVFQAVIAAEAPPGALDSPAARRNAGPLLDVLLSEIAAEGTVLEVGAGTGQHAAAFVHPLHPRRWLATEFEAARVESVRTWQEQLPAHGPRPLAPRQLDASAPSETWPVGDHAPFAAVVSVNVIHIAPWTVARGLFAGAARWLSPGAPLILYGPFAREGRHTSPGNAAFDEQLRAENADWGIRDLDRDILPLAADAGLTLSAINPMPANNLTVVFRHR